MCRKRFDQFVGLLASFSFLLLGSTGLVNILPSMPLALHVFRDVIQTLFMVFCLGFFLVTFPDGCFVPRWSWLIGCTLFVQGIFFMLPGRFNILSWPLPLILVEIVFAYTSPIAIQVYRYRRIYTPAQRRQTRWVIFGLTCFLLVFFLSIAMSNIQEHFIAAASEGPSFLTIKAQFFNGVCYDLLGKGSDALRCYESAYNMGRLNPDIIFLSQFDISELLNRGGSWIAFRMHHKEEFLKTYNKSKELLQFLDWLNGLLYKRGVRVPYFYTGLKSVKESYDKRGW